MCEQTCDEGSVDGRDLEVRGIHRSNKPVSLKNGHSVAHTLILSRLSVLHAPKGDPVYDATAIAHFYDKLLHIWERLKTEPGKKLAEKRHQLVRSLFVTSAIALVFTISEDVGFPSWG